LPISFSPVPIDISTDRCLVVAEVAQNHDGSLGTAYAYIDAIARTGADAVKFQTHIAHAESTPDEPWRVKFSRQDSSRYEYWKRMEFTPGQWADLAIHAASKGLIFLSSAFSNEAVELLDRIGMVAWKVGAGEITNLPMITRMAQTGKPVVLSTGMSPWEDVDRAVACVKASGAPVAVLQCTSMYPCPPSRLGLNVMKEIRTRYGCPTGLSDHSGAIYAGIAAATLGANFIEVHACLSRECFGPDVPASVTTGELAQLVSGVRYVEEALAHPVDKERLAEELSDLRTVFGKSVVAGRDMVAGHRVCESDLAIRKPATGIPAFRIAAIINRRLTRDVLANQPILEQYLD
jgi:N,N'-diacetyllegionaminate synthase